MNKVNFNVKKELSQYVNCIMHGHNDDSQEVTKIPIYADGYPGIMFQFSENGFYLQPKGKKLSKFFLYGQTIDPISLETKGKHSFIVLQLYPFASKLLLGVDPKMLNDDCFDMLNIDLVKEKGYLQKLLAASTLADRIALIFEVMSALIHHYEVPSHDLIQVAIHTILENDGLIKISDLMEKIPMSVRSFERNFKAQVGLNPKQFARIIQFQKSLINLHDTDYRSLTEIGLESGFSDQSHFIRTFKSYTGQTPSFYLNQN